MRRAQPLKSDPVVEIIVTDALDEKAVHRNLQLVENMIALHPARLVVDVRRCATVDEAGGTLLADLHRRVRSGGGRFTLRGLSAQLCQSLLSARLHEVLETAEAPTGYRPRHRRSRQQNRNAARERQSDDLRWWHAPTIAG